MRKVIDLAEFDKVFKGELHAVCLHRRTNNDPHVTITILAGDDGNWFDEETSFSSHWLPALVDLLISANEWLNENCEKTSEGWNFKS